MSDPWEALPDVPAATSWEDLPDVQPSAPVSVADVVPGFTAEDVSAEVATSAAQAKEERNARLKFAFDESRKTNEDDAATAVAIANKLKVPFDTVRQNLPAFKETAAAANFDPEAWATENPQLAKLVTENPHLGTLVMRSKEAGPIVRALRAAGDWASEALGIMSPEDIKAEEEQAALMGADPDAALKQGETLAQDARVRAEIAKAKRDAPAQALERQDAISAIAQEKTGLGYVNMVLWQRSLETKKALDLSRKQVRLMLAENGLGGDPAELRAEIHDLKLEAMPRALGDDSGLMRDLSEGIQGAVSTIDVGADALKGAGVAGGAGFVVGGGAALALTKSPAAAFEAGVATARVTGGKGASAAAFLSATELETGASYEALRDEETDAKQKLTPAEAMGGAVIQGLAKGVLEVVSLGQQAKVLKGALPGSITGLLKSDPTFRKLAAEVAIEYGKSIATEGLTEGLQDAVEQVGTYVQKSIKDGAAQKGPVLDTDRTAQAVQGGMLGAALAGGVTSTFALATTKTADAKAQVADRQVAPLLQLAEQPSVRAAPAEFAQLVAETTGENGKAVTSLHVDASAIVRYFQDKGQDGEQANAAVAELLGPEAPAALLEAAATGGKLEVPMEKVLSVWGASDIGKALKDDTTTDASGLTPRQRNERKAEIDAEAARIVDEETKKLDEAQLLADRTKALEQQLVDSGLSKGEAKTVAAVHRVIQEVQASDFGKPVSEVFPEAPVSFAKGDEQATAPDRANQSAIDFLQARFDAQDVTKPEDLDQRQRDFFIDSTTGVWNERAWKRIEEQGVDSVGSISVEGIKYSNDKQGGHQAGDAVYAAAAQALARYLPGLAKVKGDFAVANVPQAELDAALEKANADPRLQGYKLTGLVAKAEGGKSALRVANEKHNETKAAAEKAGTRAARGSKPLGAKEGQLTLTEKPVTGRAIADFLKEAHAKLDPKAAFRETYFEESGLLNKDGRDTYLRENPQAFHASLDLNLLKAYNDILGELAGDQFIAAFSKAMHEAGADQFLGTHVSGDEYTLDGNDPAALASFVAHLRGVLEQATIKVTSGQGQVVHIPGISFGAGIAESIDAAEAKLNLDKERLAAEGKRGRDSAASRLVAEANLARGVREATAGNGRQGGEGGVVGSADSTVAAGPAGAAAPVEGGAGQGDAGVAGGVDPFEQLVADTIAVRQERGDLRAEEEDAIRQGFNLPEQLTQARAAVEAFRAAPKKAPASEAKASKKERNAAIKSREAAAQARYRERVTATLAFLDWVDNLGPGIQEKGQAFKREGAVEVSKELLREVELWARTNFNILDPAHGVSDFAKSSGIAAVPADMRRADKNNPRTAYEKAIAEEKRRAFEVNVQGRSRVNQDGGTLAPKGYTELPPNRAMQATVRAFLNQAGDVFTALHESAHGFLEHLFDLSERPDAPQRTKDTAAAALEAFGVTSRKEVTRAHHEKFARAFEKYIGEGKAPSAALKKVFQRFTRWLVQVYRTIANIPDTSLSAELKPVFDALLATQDQLDAARRAQGPKLTAEQLAQSKAERIEQEQQEADEYTEGSHAAQLAAVKDALRLREKWWKDGLKKLEANFSDEYEALPAQRAARMLNEEQGLTPEQVAEFAGYPSAEAMTRDVANLKPRDAWVKAQAEAAMRQLHPGILDDLKRFKREINDGLRSATEKRLLREWKGIPKEALQRAATELASRRRLDQLKPNRALAQQRQAAQVKARAAAKGDIQAAGEAARAELLNHYLFHELRTAEKEIEKTRDLAKALTKESARERLGKASPVYRDAVDFILAEMGLGEARDVDAGTLPQAVAQMNGDAVLIGDPDWLAAVQAAVQVEGGFEKLTVAQALAVRDALKNLKAAATQRSTVLLDGKRVDKEQAINELLAEAAENKRPAPAVGSRDVAAVIRRVGSAFSAPLLKIETMVGWLGGNLTGKDERQSAWHRYVYRVLEGARQRESDLQRKIAEPVLKALEAMPASMRRRMGEGFDGEAAFPQHGLPGGRQKLAAPTRRHELLAMALNAGSESNLERLLGGRSITKPQLTAALNGLTKEEIDWVNSVHEAFEASWPEIQAMEERLTGIKPEGVKKQALPLANGTIKGGYFPALYDSRISGVGPMQDEASIAAMFGPSFGRPGTAHGHTNSRVQGFVGPIALNLNAIPVHLAQHIHDLAFREPVISVAGLVLDRKVQDALYAALGPERAKQFKPWVADSARVQGIEGAETAGWGLSLLSKLRGNISVAAIGYSLPNAIEDFSGIPAALADRELKPGAWAKGLAKFYGNPIAAWEDISAKSAHMRSTDDTRTRDLTHQIRGLTLDGPAAWREAKRLHAFVQRHAFVFQEASFRLTAGPLWLARHGQEIAAGGDEKAAVEAADALTRRLFPAHGTVNQPGISRNKHLAPFVQFYSFFSSVVNKNLDEWQRVLEAPGGEAKIRAAVRATAFVTTLGLLGGVLRGRGPKQDEEPEEWALWTMLSFLMAQIPFGGDVNQVLEATGKGRPVTARPGLVGSGVMAFAEGLKALDPEKETAERAQSALKAAGPLVGVPSGAIGRTGKYAAGAAMGEQDAGPADVVSGGIYGPTREGDSDLLREFWKWLTE